MEARNQVKKVHTPSMSTASGYYSHSYTGESYTGSQDSSYLYSSYSYLNSQSSQKIVDAKQRGKNITPTHSGSVYSYSVSDPNQGLGRTSEPMTYSSTGESMTNDEYSYSSSEGSVRKLAENPSQQTKEVSSFQKKDGETQSYSYSYDYSYSYSDYTPTLTRKYSGAHRSNAGHVRTESSRSKGDDAIKIETSSLGSSIVKGSKLTLSRSSGSSTGSTSYPYLYSYSYTTESLEPTHGDADDIRVDKGHTSYSSSSITESAPLYSYTYDDSATPSYSYSYSYVTSTESIAPEGKIQAQSDEYSYSGTTPYPAHPKKVSSDSYYTGTNSYNSTSYGSSSKTSSESVLVDSKSKGSSSTTYEVTNEQDSSSSKLSETEKFTQRKLVILHTPEGSTSDIPPQPSRCLVRLCTQEDSAYRFLRSLVEVQQRVEACAHTDVLPLGAAGQKTSDGVASLSSGLAAKSDRANESSSPKGHRKGAPDLKEKGVDGRKTPSQHPVAALTPKGFCSHKTACAALSVLRLNHLERREILRNVSMPMEEGTLLDILNTCAATRVRERVAKAFLVRDPSRSGELSLSVVGDVLHRLGVARSPVIDGAFRINVQPVRATRTPELCATMEVLQPDDRASDAGRWHARSIPVCDIVRDSLAAKRPTSIRLEAGSVYMGQFHICHGVPSEACFERLKTYLEAAAYVCVLVHFFSYEDDITHEVKVQYPKLVRGLLAPSAVKGRKSIYLENLFRELYHIDQRVTEFENSQGVPIQYSGTDLIESTLHETQNEEEKRRRNVIPSTSGDLLEFQTTMKGAGDEVRVSLCVQKVRISEALPKDARCYCLLSAITSDDVFLPAVEVPVRKVCASTKGGYTWVFDKKEGDEILFVGPRTDRLYVECCYEIKQEPLDEGLPTREDSTVWCAGYAVLPVAYLRETSTWPIVKGSLLDPSEGENTSTAAVESIATVPRPKRAGFFACLGLGCVGGSRKMLTTKPAVEIKVKVLKQEPKASSPRPPYENMPARYIVFRRHAELISLLRSAIHRIGKLCRHAPQALRQQFTQSILLVASDVTLMDQLTELWNHQLKHMDAAKKKNVIYQHEQLISCATTLAALYNCSSKDRESFAALAIRRKPLPHAFDANAPQCPISV